jgi:hypothetical protein
LRELDQAVEHFQRTGKLASSELPLLRHLADVALRGAPVDVPLASFG